MKPLAQRIAEAQKEMDSYPEWVRENSVFQGGESCRDQLQSEIEASQ